MPSPPPTTVGGGIGCVLKGMHLSASRWHSLCVGQVPHTAASLPCSSVVGREPRVSLPVGSGLSYVGRMSFSLHTSACSPGAALGNGTEAAKRAGYSASSRGNLAFTASDNLRKPKIQSALKQELQRIEPPRVRERSGCRRSLPGGHQDDGYWSPLRASLIAADDSLTLAVARRGSGAVSKRRARLAENHLPRRTSKSPAAVRQSGPLGHARRSTSRSSVRRALISGGIWERAGLPSTATSDTNSPSVRMTSFAISGA